MGNKEEFQGTNDECEVVQVGNTDIGELEWGASNSGSDIKSLKQESMNIYVRYSSSLFALQNEALLHPR